MMDDRDREERKEVILSTVLKSLLCQNCEFEGGGCAHCDPDVEIEDDFRTIWREVMHG